MNMKYNDHIPIYLDICSGHILLYLEECYEERCWNSFQEAKMLPITEGKVLDIPSDELEQYGKYKAKLLPRLRRTWIGDGKLVLSYKSYSGRRGSTTLTWGFLWHLAGLVKDRYKPREPSLDLASGVKGGAAGGGYSQVVPMDDINLHFTRWLVAITSVTVPAVKRYLIIIFTKRNKLEYWFKRNCAEARCWHERSCSFVTRVIAWRQWWRNTRGNDFDGYWVASGTCILCLRLIFDDSRKDCQKWLLLQLRWRGCYGWRLRSHGALWHY